MLGFKLLKTRDHDKMMESMTFLQRTLEDLGWSNLSLSDQEGISRSLLGADFKRILFRSKQMYFNNPLAGHWINLTTQFVFGEGISVPLSKEESIQEVIEEFWTDPDNQLTLTSFMAQQLISAKLQYEGNLFFVLFTDEEGSVRVRILNTSEIVEIIRLPHDRQRNAFYKVSMHDKKFDFASGNFGLGNDRWVIYADKDIPDEVIANANIPKGRFVEDVRIYHVKINTDVNAKFGVPVLHRGNDWITAHKNMAGDLATIIRSFAKFTWKKKVKGNQTQINAIRTAMSTRNDLSNKGPAAGSTQIENQGIDLQAMKTPTGGLTLAEGGLKQMNLMVSAASGIFLHYFGDPSTGNLATAKTMELPMIKKFVTTQKVWASIYDTILQYQIDKKIEVGLLQGTSRTNIKMERTEVDTKLDRSIDIDFPPILEEDLKPTAEALDIAKRSNLVSAESAARIFLNAANQNKIDEELQKIEDDIAKKVAEPKPPNPADPNNKPIPKKTPLEEAIDVPGDDNAKRLAGKTKFVEQRMNSFKKSLAGNFSRFRKRIIESLQSDGPEGKVVGNIPDLNAKIKRFTTDMQASAKKFFPEAIAIGSQFLVKHLKESKDNQKLKLVEASKDLDTLLQERLTWNETFLTESFGPDIDKKLLGTLRQTHKSDRALKIAVGASLETFESRVEQYVGAFWTVEEASVRAAGQGTLLEVNFVGPDDSESCPGCMDAVANNPHKINDAPLPGEQECLGRCRHALQVIE